ncbi:MAG: HNH endonuclease family protein [Gordonia sp. (in: high G+C Gram-positive bacteria)]|uniref:HNH endonuclease family protein n=1 Tax=Gordonia sp. (in: high G+C Gram-positive bacteria) TaxID=84139 RepID=UPI003BB67782
MSRRTRSGEYVRLTGQHWTVLSGFTVTATIVAAGLGWPSSPELPRLDPDRVAAARVALAHLEVVDQRLAHGPPYRREAFGPAWTDQAGVGGSGNSCDTRNDILARDLAVSKSIAAQTCSVAVAAGRFRSPYTGREVVFVRGRESAAVQIDHIVPLAYAWDMGAADWPAVRRIAFANDPANLIAVDGPSNQAKSDGGPGAWMPELEGFWCQYSVAFVTVSAAYRLRIDEDSRVVLTRALADC